jgi:hypothetical protein
MPWRGHCGRRADIKDDLFNASIRGSKNRNILHCILFSAPASQFDTSEGDVTVEVEHYLHNKTREFFCTHFNTERESETEYDIYETRACECVCVL